MLRPRVIDDRGSRRFLADPRHGHLTHERLTRIGGLAAWNLRQAVRAHRGFRWLAAALALAGVAYALAYLIGFSGLLPPPYALLPFFAVPLVAAGVANSDRFPGARLGRARVARALVAKGLCASCGYSIAEVTPEADGCVVCPECGAAWRSRPASNQAREETSA